MKERTVQIGIKLLLVLYTIFSLLSLSNCTKSRDDYSSLDQIKSRQADSIRLLSDRFDAERFDCDDPMRAINKAVLLDSTILGIRKQNNNYYLKAKINTGCKGEYFADLKCSGKLITAFNKTKSNYALLAAKIENVSISDYIMEADSLGGKEKVINSGIVFLLHGECLELLENTRTADED